MNNYMLIFWQPQKKINKFLGTYTLPWQNQEEIENLKRATTNNAIKFVIKKNSQETKSLNQKALQVNFSKHSKKNEYLSSQSISNNWTGGKSLKLILQGQWYPDIETRQRHYKKKKMITNLLDEHKCKNPHENTSKLIQQYNKKFIHHYQLGYSQDSSLVQYSSIN